MAGQTATMEFPVSINAQISNLKDLRTTLTNTLNAAGKDSSLAKTLTKDLAKVNQLINEAEEFTLSPTIDAAGLKALEGTFNKFFRQMQTSLQTIDLASFEQMASADDIARLKELTAEAAKYRRELEAINKSGSAEQTGKVLERTGNQDIAQRGSAYKEFNTTATLNKNAAAMGKAADAYAQQAAAMQAGIDKLAQELSQAEANSEKAKNKAKILEQNLAAVNIDTRAADFHHKAGRFATNYSAEQNVKNPTLDTIQSGLRATLESVYAGGKIATDMRATVKDWIKNLLPDVKDVDADNMVKKSVNDLLEDLMEGIFGSDYRSNPNLSYNVHHARILGNAQSYSAREIGRINAQYGISGGQDLKVISADISRELKQVRAEEREYNSEADKKWTSWDEATDKQKEFTEAAAGARQLANELENLAKAEQEAARAAKEAQIEENEQNQLDLKNARTSGVKNSGAPGRQNMGDYKTEAKEVFDDAGEVLGGKQAQIDEAAQFTANLKQSIKSWMSAQQIINIVKQGIRQAYQDIQNLDKAMTNIAVVTDMSVGDLWGKINEYMSIAQQYGVSTQGVYEVSQLYYQQGLGTADVMAATTETLKMARIAGMDYAEAADAMTVAIRSFKMEMSDAAHVTDVYSKVAAVTASDSEELAIAMSKTASSAESVGSSFENTTAMLAVMIETTRESAQNLGSALKSIISRYGEMKVGMTVDSEGEALDYNKVDTALQSVGISLKDAQGQFRDFDEVIFELSEKWDSLDSVTQRYIATIMAGNRQQSRFIALVDNWERLDEVAGAAQDSEDAGLLQYAKTLDSLETKITNIKTSFQEFYMSLVNGPVVGAALEGINNILKGFNKLGNWQAILNIAGFIRSVKSIAKLLVSAISPSFSSIVSDFKSSMQEMVEVARQKGYEAGKGYSENYNAGANGQSAPTGGSGSAPAQQSWLSARMIGDKSGKTSWDSNSWNGSKMAGRVQIGGQLIGAAASIIGSSVAKDNQRAGAVISGVGNIAQGASMGAALGPWGAVIGGVIGGLASLPAVLDAFDPASVLKEKLEKAEEALSEANIERAQTKDTYTRLDAYIKKLRQLEATRFDSTESYEEWTALNAEVLEAFPELASSFDEANNAIVDLNRAENSLTEARLAASEAAKKAADAQIAAALAREKVVKQENNTALNELEKNLDTTLKTVSNYDQYHSSSSDIESAKAYSQERIDAIKASQLAENQYYTGTDWTSAAKQAAAQGQRVFAYTNSYGMTSLSFANSNVANALPFIDSTNTEAINWLVNLANTTDPQEYATVLANGFKQEFLNKEMLPEYAESGLVSNLGPQDFRYGEINTMNALGNKLLGEFGLLERKSFQSELATDSAIRSSIAQYVSSSFLGIENSDIPYTELAGINQVFQNELIKDFKATLKEKQKTNADFSAEDLWESWTLDNYTTKFANLEKEYKQFYENLNYSGKIEDYNAFIANADSYNRAEYNKILRTEFGLERDSELYQILTEQFKDEYNSARETFIESLKNVDFINKRETGKDEAGEAIYELEKEPVNIPKEYMDEITAFARRVQGYVDDDMMSDISADSLWDQYLAIWNTIDSTGTETQQAILRRLLGSADLATPEGVAAFEQAIKAETALEGLDTTKIIASVKGLIPDSIVNLNASYASLMSNISSNIDAQAAQLSKAGDGFGTLAETQEFADKSGLELSDFTFDNGKWYLNYSQETAEKIKASVQKDFKTQKELLKDANEEQVKAVENSGIDQLDKKDFTTAESVINKLGLTGDKNIEARNVINQHWENYVAWAKEDSKNTSTFIEYLRQNYQKDLDDLTSRSNEYLTWAQQELEKADRESKRQRSIDSRVEELSGSFNYQKITEAWNSIVSQGLTGYSAEDIATLEHDLGIQGLGIRQADGSYDLAIAKLQGAPQWVRNALLNTIQGEIESAKSAIEGLGGDIFEATESDYSEAFSYLAEAGFQGKEIKKGINYALMQSVVGDPTQLKKYIGKELAHKMGRDYTDEFAAEFDSEITASQEEMTAAFKDSYIERIQTYNDLVYKKIVGTATFAELEKLDDVATELNIDLSEFTGRLIDDLASYAQGIIDNAYLSAEEKQKYLKDSFNTMLGARAYAEVYGVDANYLTQDAATRMEEFSAANKTLRSTKNRMTQSQASEAAAAYANLIGIDPMIVASMFDYNQSDSTFSYDSSLGTTARDIQLNTLWKVAEQNEEVMAALAKQEIDSAEALIGITSQSDMERVIAAISETGNLEALNVLGNYRYFEELATASKQAEIFGSEARADKYASAIQQFASGQEMTFEELVALYSDLDQVINDPNQLYDLWLKGPAALEAELSNLAAADTTLTGEQQEAIRQAQQAGVDALLSTITSAVDKAVSGTATLDDLYTIAKNTGVDLTGLVSKTGSGYGLNQQGMLAVAAARAQKSGDYSGEAAKLIETYAGKGGIFGNAKALDSMLTAMGKAVDDTQTLINNAEAQAIKDKKQEDTLYKKEKESLEKQKELQEAQVQILKQAQQAFKLSDAKNAANFMGVDPFGGALEDYDNYVNSHKAAQEVLKAAYSNGGIIADYKQAGQLLNFIGYGQDWTQNEANKNLNTLLKHTTNEGTDFAAAYREIFELGDTLSDSEVLLKAAELMDKAAEKMQKELDARIEANEAFADWHEKTVTDTTKRVALTEEQVKNQLLETKTEGDKTSTTLKTDSLISHITGKYMTTLENDKQVGITEATIKEIAATRYGSDWETDLADAGKLTSFLSDIDSLFANFKYDQSSDLSYDEQFASYAKGEAAAQEVEERLNQLSDQIKGIVTDEQQMEPLIAGIDKAIQKAEYLNRLLVDSQSGHAYTTGYNKEHGYTGVIYTDASNLTNPDNKGTEAIFAGLKETYGLSKDWVKNAKIKQDLSNGSYYIAYKHMVEDAEGNKVLDPSKSFRYTFRSMDQLAATGADPNAEFKVTGQFEEVDKWIAENKHIEAVYTLTTPKDAKNKLEKEIEATAREFEDLTGIDSGALSSEQLLALEKSITAVQKKLESLKQEQADLNKRYPNEEDGTVQLKVTGTAPESDAELIKWKEDLAKALEGAGNVELTITDDKGNVITDINSITKGQQITISAGLADGTTKDTIQTLVNEVNGIIGGLEKPTVKIEVTGLTADTVTTVTDLKDALENLKKSPAASGVTINIGGDAATNAAEIIKNINAATNDGKPHEASLNFAVSYTVNGKAVDFNEKGLPVLPKADEDAANENANDGDKEDPGSITLTIKEVDPASAAAAKKAINDLGKDVQITFKQGDKEFTDVKDLVPDAPIDIQIQYKVDDEAGKSTSKEIVDAIGEIAGKKSVDITVTGLDDETAKKVTQLATDLAELNNPPETINIEVKDKDGNSLTLANDFATKLGTIKPNYESAITITVKYVDENGNPITLDAFTPPQKEEVPDDDIVLQTSHTEEDRWNAIQKWQHMRSFKADGFNLGITESELDNILTAIQYGQLNSPEYAENYFKAEELYKLYESQKEAAEEQYHATQKAVALEEAREAAKKKALQEATEVAAAEVAKTLVTPELVASILPPFLFTGTTANNSEMAVTVATEEAEAQVEDFTDEVETEPIITTIEANTDPAKSKSDSLRQDLGKSITIPVNIQFIAGGSGGALLTAQLLENLLNPDGASRAEGNVNGLAYAEGNVDSLIAGAHLANKTLVGELGPELGVWNGQYHLLGQHGAEFVDMPSDAIVFNHRQTAGILQGQWGHRGKALADGNITGPARVNSHTITPPWATAGGYAAFLESLGKGNRSKTYKFTEVGEELEEWYNLLRKIAKLEKEITLEQAKRENMLDGHDWLKSYREQQSYLHEQIAVQKLLIDYQKEQLALERERIEQDEWWSSSLTFNEDGTLLSIFGNEVGGGEGVFAYLDMLNNMSGNEQIAALKKLGYSYVGKDGKALEGEELVKKFIEEYTEIVGSYNELDDSILDAETKIEELTKAINDLEQEIKENQKELEKTIYDLLVDAAEKEIEQIEEQNELLKEANQKYIDGLNDALTKEQKLYEQNKSIEEREALQRQLSLLRRSGGSASEIEALEQQLDDTLKNEYFNKQQQMIEDITKANERQTELMEQQVKLQQDALEYQKENGVIWTRVYEVMSGSYEQIIAFLTKGSTEFFEASTLTQEIMLLDWAKMVGIYDEDRASKGATKIAKGHWTNGTMEEMFAQDTNTVEVGDKKITRQDQYNALSDKDKKAAQEHYNTAFTNAVLEGKTEEEARQIAYNSMVERFRTDGEDIGITRFDPRGDGAGTGSDNSSGSYTGKNVYFKFIDKDSKQTITTKSKWYKYGSNILYTYGLEYTPAGYTASHGDPISITNFSDKSQNIITYYCTKKTTATQQGQTNSAVPSAEQLTREIEALTAQLNNAPKTSPAYESMVASVKMQLEQKKAQRLQFYGYSEGGLVDYTGVAMVHGSKSKPESFLNAEQTAQITAALRETTGKESVLASLQSTMDKLKSVIHNFSTVDNSTAQSISIAPGAVVIQVEQLADSYDIEEVSRDVMNRMVAIANKATNRGVNRR